MVALSLLYNLISTYSARQLSPTFIKRQLELCSTAQVKANSLIHYGTYGTSTTGQKEHLDYL